MTFNYDSIASDDDANLNSVRNVSFTDSKNNNEYHNTTIGSLGTNTFCSTKDNNENEIESESQDEIEKENK